MHPINPAVGNMVGEAYTLRYIPAREDIDVIGVYADPEHPQRKAIESCPPGHVLVMDSRKDARAASAGDILVTRLMVRGVAGVVTDGGFRDTPSIAKLTIPAYHQRPSARRGRSCTTRPTSSCRSAAATSPSIRGTSWSATARVSSSCRRIWPTRWPRKPSR